MNILMLRFDIFEELHTNIYDLWKDILRSYTHDNVKEFTEAILLGHEISYKMLPNTYILLESYSRTRNTLNAIRGEQVDISDELKGEMVDTNGTRDIIILRSLTKEEEKRKEDFYEVNNAIRILIHEKEGLESLIRKEMKKFWNCIDTLIINSYKQMLYDVTGSDDLVRAFMNEVRTVGLSKNLNIAKREHNYDNILVMIDWLNESTEGFLYIIERILIGEQHDI